MNEQQPKYVIDTSSLLELPFSYPKDNFPGVWQKIEELIDEGKMISSEEVLIELGRKDDDIFRWAKDKKESFFPIDKDIQIAVTKILTTHGNIVSLRGNKSNADPFIIALASIQACTIVTQETPTGNPARLKIPDVCNDLKIECLTLVGLLKREELKLQNVS